MKVWRVHGIMGKKGKEGAAMEAAQRREWILKELSEAKTPQSATKLARQLGVSRQIVVGDVAILRASGKPVQATPRGYVLQTPPAGNVTVASCHEAAQVLEELYTIVDCGCGVLDVTVEHPVYGEMCAPLQIFSREEAEDFVKKLEVTQPLCCLTGGVHLHRLQCPTPAHEQRVLKALQEKGFLQT